MTPHTEPEVLLKMVWKELEKNAEAFERGEAVDMSALEERAKEFCTIIEGLPTQEGLRYQLELQKLMQRLNEWADQLRHKQEDITKQLQNLNKQAQAQAAYIRNSKPGAEE